AGAHWKTIAAEVGRSERSLQRWPYLYAAFWDRCFEVGLKKFLGGIIYEAILQELKHMRGDDVKVSQSASQFLIRRVLDLLMRFPGVIKESAEARQGEFYEAAAYIDRHPEIVM